MVTRFKSGQEVDVYRGMYGEWSSGWTFDKYNGDGTANVSFSLHGSSLCSVHTVDEINIRLPLPGTEVISPIAVIPAVRSVSDWAISHKKDRSLAIMETKKGFFALAPVDNQQIRLLTFNSAEQAASFIEKYIKPSWAGQNDRLKKIEDLEVVPVG